MESKQWRNKWQKLYRTEVCSTSLQCEPGSVIWWTKLLTVQWFCVRLFITHTPAIAMLFIFSSLLSPKLCSSYIVHIETRNTLILHYFLMHGVKPTWSRTGDRSVYTGWVCETSYTEKVLSVQPSAPPSWWILQPSIITVTTCPVVRKRWVLWKHWAYTELKFKNSHI